jgi:hypothetical protein
MSVVHRSVSNPTRHVQTRCRVSPIDRPCIPCKQSARPIAARQHRREPATALAPVAADDNYPCFWLPSRHCRTPDLALSQAVAHEHHHTSWWPARGPAAAAARGAYLRNRRNFFRPFLDVDR